jgi:hypothetical protein
MTTHQRLGGCAFAAPIFSLRTTSLHHSTSVATLRSSNLPSAARRARCPPSSCAAPPTPPTGTDTPKLTPAQVLAVVLAAPSFPLLAYSEFKLATSGCGLPPGPGGSLGAAEGLSYLVLGGIVVWSAATKIRTGKGLPAGPGGVLGAVEGVAYLLALVGIAAAGYVAFTYGSLPSAVPLPGSRCFPVE